MLDEKQKNSIRQWYRQEKILAEAKLFIDKQEWEALEEFIQMRALFPLGQHSSLPDYLKTEDGGPLIPSNADPRKEVEDWRDAIEAGWEVIDAALGYTRDTIHLAIKEQQEASWETFLRSVDERNRDREKNP